LLNEVGLFLHTRATYAEAEPLYKRALAIREAALGLEHSDVAQSLNNLADLYQVQGQYWEAAALYERALGIMEPSLRTHPNSATKLENYANCLDNLSRGEEAGQCGARAATINSGQNPAGTGPRGDTVRQYYSRLCWSPSMELGRTTPILRIFYVAKKREFCIDFLGFSVDWEHRFGENFASYKQLSRRNCILHLSEHHGDSTPGSRVLIETSDRLAAKKARCARLQVS